MKIFVIHYKKLFERKVFMLQQFNKYNITDYEFIEIDRDELYKENLGLFEENYQKHQIAICLSHFHAYKQIAEKHEHALILEDDAILSTDFMNKFNMYISQLPQDYDMLFIGDGCFLHIQNDVIVPNKYIYEKGLYPTYWGGDGAVRCTDSYIVNKKCAIKLCEYINNLNYKINTAVDWFLSRAARDNHLKVYWAEPTIVTQGTQNGLFAKSY